MIYGFKAFFSGCFNFPCFLFLHECKLWQSFTVRQHKNFTFSLQWFTWNFNFPSYADFVAFILLLLLNVIWQICRFNLFYTDNWLNPFFFFFFVDDKRSTYSISEMFSECHANNNEGMIMDAKPKNRPIKKRATCMSKIEMELSGSEFDWPILSIQSIPILPSRNAILIRVVMPYWLCPKFAILIIEFIAILVSNQRSWALGLVLSMAVYEISRIFNYLWRLIRKRCHLWKFFSFKK